MVERMYVDGEAAREERTDRDREERTAQDHGNCWILDDDSQDDRSRSSDDSQDGFGTELPPPPISIPGMFGCAPLTDGWKCRFEETTGQPYYHQPGKDTTWDLPFDVDPRNKFSKEHHPNRVEGTYWTNGFENQREAPEEEFIYVQPVHITPLIPHSRSSDSYSSASLGGSDDDESREGCELVEQEDGSMCYYKEGVMKPVGERGGAPVADLKDWAVVQNEDGSLHYHKDGEIKVMGKDGRLY